ncbi:nitrile hydratase subunit beta [Tateyamaria omphalii]|uniref:nitrile hydratase subunit beta n=1 Tax=Tateyamaria omphalii TaxID=299262 RepID=UPI001C990B72|nr:nitrile hydratase subunit beta [Tateyamaria omphalii]MBY5933087.1 nitrile hydratase subunit beta [Tateyamaria omphalii]
MTRIHDMGGRFGDGPVVPEPEHVKFHADWHPRALAITLACGTLGLWNIDVSRHARESLSPKDYGRFSYYEKWMAALADLLVETGAVTRAELEQGVSESVSNLADKRLVAAAVAGVLAKGGPATRDSNLAPFYAVGDVVTIRAMPENVMVPGGHTRLPSYAAGASGTIVRLHGAHVLPDSNAHRLGEAPEPLYAVAVKARDIWAHPEHPEDEVILDLWQSYLSAP